MLDHGGERDRAAVAWVESASELWVHGVQEGDAARVRALDERVALHTRPVRWTTAAATTVAAATAALTPVLVLAGYGLAFAVAAVAVARRRPLHAVAG